MRARTVIAIAVLLVAGLLVYRSTRPDPAPRTQYDVYLDVSKTSFPRLMGSTRGAVEDLARQAAAERAVLTLHVIDAASTSQAPTAAGERLPELPGTVDFNAAPEGLQSGEQTAWRTLQVQNILTGYMKWATKVHKADGTDILGAMANAVDVPIVAGHSPVGVFVTDGINHTDVWTWPQRSKTPAECKSLAMSKATAVPDLTGLKVQFLRTGHDDIDSAGNASLKACWKAILDARGAHLDDGWWTN